jgi:diketogulonate reductase-like aldo/keto reductase
MPTPSPDLASCHSPSDTVQLRDGVDIPVLGLGVFMMSTTETRAAVTTALAAGYRLVDTASVYGNEAAVGKAVQQAGTPAFLVTKLWNADHGYQQTLRAFELSRQRLGTSVVDLFLVHWPVPGKRLDTWRAMERLLEEGKVRAIGVSNYMTQHLEELLDVAVHPPSVNQIELSPFNFRSREDVVDLCRSAGITMQAYSPLTKGRFLDDPTVSGLARRHRRTEAQVLIRWALQKGFIPLPKSADAGRIAANADVFDFSLSEEDIELLDSLDQNLVTPGWDPTGAP